MLASSPYSAIVGRTVYGLPMGIIKEEKLTNLTQHTKPP